MMELVCPLCNGMLNYETYCPRCSDRLKDTGPIVDYLDEYSPYLSNDMTQLVDGVEHEKCCHLFKCEKCNFERKVEINRVRM